MHATSLSAILAAASPAFAADLARVSTETRSFQTTHSIDGVEVSFCGNVLRAGKGFRRSHDIEIDDLLDGDVSVSETTDGHNQVTILFGGSRRKASAICDRAAAIHKAGGTIGELVELPALLAPIAAMPMPRPDYDDACKPGDEDLVHLDFAFEVQDQAALAA